MHPLDEKLEQLVLQAQQYPPDSKERLKIIQELWVIMLPSSTLKGHTPKPTDDEAKRRLGKSKATCRNIYGANLEGDFDEDWPDGLPKSAQKVFKRIDIYKKGVDLNLYEAWLKFRETSSQPTPDVYLELEKQVEKFQTRFLKRRTKNGTKPYPQENSERLVQACQNLCETIRSGETDLQQVWNTFCEQVQQLFEPRSFWYWFDYYLDKNIKEIIRQRGNIVSGDAPTGERDESSANLTRFDKFQAKAASSLSKDVIRLIKEDPDGIFQGKHIENFPKENFRVIALLKFKGATLQKIGNYFNHPIETTRELTEEEKKRLYAQGTISSFYKRKCHYFKPILEEYLEAKIALPPSVIEQIVNDAEGRYNKRRMPEHSQITFKGIIQSRLGGVPSWTILARQLQVNVRELIYFYLESISYFKLIPQQKTRTRRSKTLTQP
jgi:hypothetical protein